MRTMSTRQSKRKTVKAAGSSGPERKAKGVSPNTVVRFENEVGTLKRDHACDAEAGVRGGRRAVHR